MTFTDFLRNKSGLTTFSAKSVTESFLDVYLWMEFPDRGSFLKDKDSRPGIAGYLHRGYGAARSWTG
jgi:hypothetical protein